MRRLVENNFFFVFVVGIKHWISIFFDNFSFLIEGNVYLRHDFDISYTTRLWSRARFIIIKLSCARNVRRRRDERRRLTRRGYIVASVVFCLRMPLFFSFFFFYGPTRRLAACMEIASAARVRTSENNAITTSLRA